MTLQLDARRMAMLREMGLQLLPAVAEPTESAVVQSPEAAPPRAGAATSAGGAASAAALRPADDPGVAGPQVGDLDWDALAARVAALRGRDPGTSVGGPHAVLGSGPVRADWMVVADPPDAHEDPQDEPFTGAAAKLLDNMLRGAGLDRKRSVYLSNLMKCRPAGGAPDDASQAAFLALLRRQVALVQPRVVLAMGRLAVQALAGSGDPIGKLRGRLHDFHGTAVVVTYHPAYLLRNPQDKARTWADLCLALDCLDGRLPS
jgi:DNA polymerase